MDLETSIRSLTIPLCGQYPRPWTTHEDIKHPEKARVFIVGFNQATPLPVEKVDDIVSGRDGYMDALHNRNGRSILGLLKDVTGEKGFSPTRKNIECLRCRLSNVGIEDVIETNVICFGASTKKAMSKCKEGMERGRIIFRAMIEIIRPKILIVHGKGAAKELRRALSPEIPVQAASSDVSVSCKRIKVQLSGEFYEPNIVAIPSLALPEWNKWHDWAPGHLAETCSMVKKFLDDN